MKDFYYDRDPLRVDLLPKNWQKEPMSLSYRAKGTREDEYKNPFTPYLLLTAAIMSFGAVLVLRLLLCDLSHLGDYVLSWNMGLLAFALSAVDALPRFFADERPRYWAIRAMIPVAVWLTVICVFQPSWLLYLLLFVVTMLLVEVVTDNYVKWLLADRSSKYNFREMLRIRWRCRFEPKSWLIAVTRLLREGTPLGLTDSHLPGLLLLALGFGVAYLPLVRFPMPMGGLLCVLTLFVWLFAQGLIAPFWVRMGSVPVWLRVKATAQAVDTWLSYNPRDRRAPGLHQSPYGTSRRRLVLACSSVLLITTALNIIAAYYPVLMLGSSREIPWLEQVAWKRSIMERDGVHYGYVLAIGRWVSESDFFNLSDSRPKPQVDYQALASRLGPAEKVYYQQLATEEARRAYLNRFSERPSVARAKNFPFQTADINFLRSSPEAWLLANYLGLFTGQARFSYSFALSLFLGFCAPVLFVFLCIWAVAGAELALVEDTLNRSSKPGGDEPQESREWYNQEWLGLAESLRYSRNELEREHLFLGFAQDIDHDDEYPVLFHRKLIGDHVYINGSSGSGKSSRGIAAIVSQLAYFARGQNGRPGDSSILILDLKGDDALFHGIRHEARGLPFRWYRDQVGLATHGFNPLLQSHLTQCDAAQKARAVMDAFGLRAGDGFGERYFADIQEAVVRRVFELYPNLRSLKEMHDVLQGSHAKDMLCPEMPQPDWNHASHLREQVAAFARCEVLNDTSDDPSMTIDFPSLFTEPQIVYFYAPSLVGGGTNIQAAKFALYSLLTASKFVAKKNRLPVYCVIDEFQELAGTNIGVVLRQARSFDVALILANQLASDLNTAGAKLEETVTNNVALTWSFRPASKSDMEKIVFYSGEYLETLRSMTVTHNYGDVEVETPGFHAAVSGEKALTSVSYSYQQHYRPALNVNRVLWSSYVEDLSIARFSEGSGYTRYFRPMPLRTLFHVSKELFDKRAAEPWPDVAPPAMSPNTQGVAQAPALASASARTAAHAGLPAPGNASKTQDQLGSKK